MDINSSHFFFSSHKKTIPYNPTTNLLILFTKSRISKSYNLIQDGSILDTLLSNQRQLLYQYRRLAHMDFEKIKILARKGLLPNKDITNCKTLLYSFCIQAKQPRTSITANATSSTIKSRNLKPRDKASCN